MKFTVVTYGTEGDTRPLLGLAEGLARRGHLVTFMADRSTLPARSMRGIHPFPMAGDMKASFGPGGAFERLTGKNKSPGKFAQAVARIAADNSALWMHDLRSQARNADAILFSGIASYAGLSVAEFLGKPAIGLGLWPMTPTAAFPSPLLPPTHLPGWLNKLSHQSMNALLWRMFRTPVNAARLAVCAQAPRRRMWRDYPVLYGFSARLVPPPRDWPRHVEVCGEWTVQASERDIPADLRSFLDAGPAPVYVGFGSMAGFDQERLLSVVVEAVGRRRALFAPGWSGLDTRRLPSNFFAVGNVPHSWLFPRMAMAIHHGGAGTSHAAARAGVPSVVLPFTGDQPFWARRLAEAGVAPPFIPAMRVKAAELAHMISFAEQPSVRARAEALAGAMAREDGVAVAVARIEALVQGDGSTHSSPEPLMFRPRAFSG